MNKNDIITLEITAIANSGSGLGRYDGQVVFVPFTAVGDVIECRVLKVTKSSAYGKAERVVTPSPDRIETDCPAAGKCGGCDFRHISYEAELRAKEGFVKDAFRRIGGIEAQMLPIMPSESVVGYRNKLQMPVSKRGEEIVSGFYATNSHRIVETAQCPLHPPIFMEIVEGVKRLAKRYHVSVYDEGRNCGVLRHICIRQGYHSGEICVCLVVKRKVPELYGIASELMERFPDIKGVVANINREATNVILGEKELTLKGSPTIRDSMCGVPVELSAKSFYQVNTAAAENLYRQAAAFAEPEGKTILDLYCGTGTIGLSMAGAAGRVIGADIVPQAIENAKRNAASFPNAEFMTADAADAAEHLTARGEKPDVIILDPPRKGCSEQTLDACVKLSPQRIVMISCDPATAARDCKRLAESGYTTEKIRPFDLFPRTKHVETVCLLSRNK